MITMKIAGIDTLAREMDAAGRPQGLAREVTIAVNQTLKKVQRKSKVEVRKHLLARASFLNAVIKVTGKASTQNIGGTVSILHGARLSLKAFSASHKAKGVTYRATSGKGGTKVVPGGFMGAKPGQMSVKLKGHAYKRLGGARYPIARLHAASPWGAFLKKNLRPIVVRDGEELLEKAIERRLNYNLWKRTGSSPNQWKTVL